MLEDYKGRQQATCTATTLALRAEIKEQIGKLSATQVAATLDKAQVVIEKWKFAAVVVSAFLTPVVLAIIAALVAQTPKP